MDFTIDPTFIDQNTHLGSLNRSRVLPGDILINIVGPPLGKISVVSNKYSEWNINQAIARIRIDNDEMKRFFVAYFKTDYAQDWFIKHSKRTSGQRNLTLKTVQDFPVPILPKKILNKVQDKFDQGEIAVERVSYQIELLKNLIKSMINEMLCYV